MVAVNELTTQFSMDAIFTPPSPCSTSWTFEPQGANGVESGLVIQNAVSFVSSCFPSDFDQVGRMQGSLVYSPGWCPKGYTSADVAIDREVTTAICCLSDFGYTTEVLKYGDGGSDTYAGCTSVFSKGSSTIVPVRQETTSTRVIGPVTMWAQPITVALESSDTSLFVPPTSSTPSVARETSTTPTPRPSSTDDTSSDSAESSSGQLSSSAGIGIGVGVGVGGFAILAAVGLWLWRSRKIKRRREQDQMTMGTAGYTQPDMPYSPVKESAPVLEEMDGSNGGPDRHRDVRHELA
ncbi:uncharacterized protein APUU_31221A [Aspergillus puulaauensis]|uniref:Mid2 domain-containing protein n=1 Tax=Aspergillus puulaauensis TaxID=1220207 RepID=A0A7R7XK72_9EURO|nr:uncharacterized protein APUU_31221A [Aspergillus puulaauensis]BCS22996.1 hypothetical protein APUU_31221A [Aspergillus puulaauensis]